MVQSTERPDGRRPSNHHPGAVLCHCHHGPDAQSRSQGCAGWEPPGRASFPVSAYVNSVAFKDDYKFV